MGQTADDLKKYFHFIQNTSASYKLALFAETDVERAQCQRGSLKKLKANGKGSG